MATVPTRQTSEAELNQFNVSLRSQPWYQAYFAQRGLDPNKVKLSDRQQGELETLMAQNGVTVPSGMHIDPAGNLNQKNTLGRNLAIGAGVGAGAFFGGPALLSAIGSAGPPAAAGTVAASATPAATTATTGGTLS